MTAILIWTIPIILFIFSYRILRFILEHVVGKKISFLGLGVMGYHMAGHLQQFGHNITVYNRTIAKAQEWVVEFGGEYAKTPYDAVKNSEIVFACVGADRDLTAISRGDEGAFNGMKKGAIFVDHTTVSANISKELAANARLMGLGYLDAPVSGGEIGAKNGKLTIMVGGDESEYKRIGPVIEVYAKMQKLMGPVGAGQTTKMVNQICIAGIVQGLSEALHFAIEAGLDAEAVVEVISKGAAQSWQMENRHKTMIEGEFDHGFAVDWMRKDLAIVLDEAEGLGISLPITRLVDKFYGEVQEMGGARQDTSALIRRFRG